MAIAAVWQWLLARLSGRPSVRERHEQMAETARRRAEKAGTLYDAYPPDTSRPRVRIVLIGKDLMEPVDLDGYSLREINLSLRWRQAFLIRRIHEAHIRLVQRLEAKRVARDSPNTPSSSP